MITIKKVYKKDCQPCVEMSAILEELADSVEFKLEEFDITSTAFTERRKGKSILSTYATTNIPFLLFVDEEGKEYAALYQEEGPATLEKVLNKLNNA